MNGIKSINSKDLVIEHFMSLSDEDRYSRFGHKIKKEALDEFITKLDMHHNEFWGFTDKGQITALIHISCHEDAVHCERVATFGLSVLASHRGKGLAQSLFDFAYARVKSKGVSKVYMSCLAHNEAIKKICSKANMQLQTYQGEIEAVTQ